MLKVDIPAIIAKFFANLLNHPMFPVAIIVGCLIGLLFLAMLVSLGFFIYFGIKKNGEMQKKCMKICKPSLIGWVVAIVAEIVLAVIVAVQTAGQTIQSL